MKILVIGYYGHMNAGDDLLQQAMCHIFLGHNLMFVNWSPGTLVMEECDLIVVGGGSIWPGFSFFQHARQFAKELRIPIFVLGISVKEHNEATKLSTIPLIEKAAIFHVRDKESAEYFDNSPNLVSGIDLMWWLPKMIGDNRTRTYEKRVGLNLRSWRECKWDPVGIVSELREKNFTINPIPMCFGAEKHQGEVIPNDYELLTSLGFTDAPPLWSDLPIRDSSLVISMRFHGLLIATRMGIPCIGFNYHPKIVSYFSGIGMPELCVPLNDTKLLGRTIEQVFDDYDGYADKFESISKELRKRGEKELKSCREILDKIIPRKEPAFIKRIVSSALTHL